MDNLKVSELQSKLLSQSRYNAKKSQEFMAMGLGVAKNTVYNWESGTSSPNIKQFIQWFELLGMNPIPFLLQFGSPNIYEDISANDSDQDIKTALIDIINSLPNDMIRSLLYILYGSHGSDPYSVIQMILADLHCDMRSRVTVARTILENYEMAEQRGELVETNHIMPDIKTLKEAVELGKKAAMSKQSGYTHKKD